MYPADIGYLNIMAVTYLQDTAVFPRSRFFNWRRRSELGMILIALLAVSFAYVLLSLSLTARIPTDIGWFLGIIALITLIMHISVRIFAPYSDPIILPIVTILNGLGYVIIARLDIYYNHPFAPYQAAWTGVSALVFVLTLLFVKRSKDLDRYRYLIGLAGFILLIAPVIPGLGFKENGALLWIHIGSLTFQPVEIAKLLFVIFFASYIASNKEMLSTGTKRIGRLLLPDPRSFAPVLLAWAGAMGVMGLEDDIGFALMFFVVFISMLWTATGRKWQLGAGALLFLLGMYAGDKLFPQVGERITAWLHPWKYPNSIGYQPVQSLIALGTGNISGTGLGLGHPNYIPVANADFIFSVIGEEFGIFGTVAILTAFILILGSGLRIAIASKSDFSKLLSLGMVSMLCFQALFIMGGIVQLLPLTGITLPFVSYGGSSLVANYVLIAIILRVSSETNDPDNIIRTIEIAATED
jgi:cell division protein FtsW (lipid II flippase)